MPTGDPELVSRSISHNPEKPDYLPLRRTLSTPAAPECNKAMSEAIKDLKAPITPFAGRLGGNQEFIVNRYDPDNASLLEQIPDAAPLIPLKGILDLRGFREPELYRAGIMEAVGPSPITLLSSPPTN